MNTATGKHYVPGFHFDPADICYCGSGTPFGTCCASTRPDRSPPAGVTILNNYLSTAECRSFLRFAKKQPREWLSVLDAHQSTPEREVRRRDPARVAQLVELGKKDPQAVQWIDNAVRQFISPINTPEWFELPQLLRYGPGGKYHAHSDAEHYDPQQGMYFRTVDRDFSLLIYLNDDYEGGSLRFEHLNYTYKPSAGDLLIFPSNHVFSHESMPITSGTKYALVSWGAFINTPRVLSTPNKIAFSSRPQLL